MNCLIYQEQEKGCGYASVKMALCYFSKRPLYQYLEEQRIESEAPSLKELISFGARHGLFLRAFRLEKKEDLSFQEPILAMIEENGSLHLVFLKKKCGKTFFLLDPAMGKRKLKEEEFNKLFTGVFLKKEHYSPVEESLKKPIYENRVSIFLLSLLKGAGVIFAFSALYFIDEEGSFFLTILLFICFALSIVFYRLFTSKRMKDFDDKYLSSLSSIKPRDRKDSYMHYLRYKTGIFGKAPSLVASLLEVVALLGLFSLNEPWMGASLLILLGIMVLERAFLYPRLLRREGELASLENEFLGESGGVEAAKRLSSLTYKIADILSFRDYCYLFLEAILALAVAFLGEGSTSLNAFFVWLMGLYLFGEESQKLLESIFGREDFKKESAYFRGHFAPKGNSL